MGLWTTANARNLELLVVELIKFKVREQVDNLILIDSPAVYVS